MWVGAWLCLWVGGTAFVCNQGFGGGSGEVKNMSNEWLCTYTGLRGNVLLCFIYLCDIKSPKTLYTHVQKTHHVNKVLKKGPVNVQFQLLGMGLTKVSQ